MTSLTRWRGSGRNRTWRSPSGGDEGGAALGLVIARTRPAFEDGTYRPEVVDEHVEHAQQQHQHDGAELSLEANDDHDAGDEAKQTNDHTPQAPLAGEDEPDEEEDQQNASRELDVHLAVLLVELRQSRGHELLADPRIGQDHEKTADDTEVAEEEVEIKDESVSEALGDDDQQ